MLEGAKEDRFSYDDRLPSIPSIVEKLRAEAIAQKYLRDGRSINLVKHRLLQDYYFKELEQKIDVGQPMLPPTNEGDATGGVIPYKNPHALIAYYLGIVSLVPLIGVPFGLAAVILGFIGLSRRKKNPVIKGSAHAWIGIVFGFLSILCGAGFVVLMIFGVMAS